jgi:hypothetical protein
MTVSAFAAGSAPDAGAPERYEPGVCNIGPAEVAYRRMWGHLGLLVTLLTLIGLFWFDAPPAARFLVALPAWGTAVAYFQAWFKFCVAFASLGVFNFGRLGSTERVVDAVARRRDRARALQVVFTGLLAGISVGAVAVLLPF